MSTYTTHNCAFCATPHETARARGNHQRYCKENPNKTSRVGETQEQRTLRSVCCLRTKKEMLTARFNGFLANFMNCPQCGIEFCNTERSKYCSKSCWIASGLNKGRDQSNNVFKKRNCACVSCGVIVKDVHICVLDELVRCDECKIPHLMANQKRYRADYENKILEERKVKYAALDFACAHCSSVFKILDGKKRRCCSSGCLSAYREARAAMYKRTPFVFKFKITEYPDLFDVEKYTRLGSYNPKYKVNGKPENKNGLVRDHIVSVHESIVNNYDPYYISHPLNCQLMGMVENLQKGKRSSITYEELVRRVDEYDNKKK